MNMKFKCIILILSSTLIKINDAQNLTVQAHNSWIDVISFTNDNKVVTTSTDKMMKAWDPFKNMTLVSGYFQNIPTSCCVCSSIGVNNNGR